MQRDKFLADFLIRNSKSFTKPKVVTPRACAKCLRPFGRNTKISLEPPA